MSGIIAVTAGNLLGVRCHALKPSPLRPKTDQTTQLWLDRNKISLKVRARGAFWTIVTLQGAWWVWATVLVSRFQRTRPTYDWSSSGFGAAFGVFIFLTLGFQLNYMFLYFIIHNIARDEAEVIRYAALLRGTESAWQAVSYGLTSLTVFAEVGGVYMNFGLWGVAILPAWLVLREFGAFKGGDARGDEVTTDSPSGKDSSSGKDIKA